MGGLLERMPRTGWTFIVGGLALSGLPFITAGFWSKDEILASAWSNGNINVFWTLAIAAFLTAFYTMRQIGLTFLGEPRTEAARHAPESVGAMTWPLVLITPFAIAAGWFGIPDDFPLLGAIPNWIEHFLEPYVEYQEFHAVHPLFSAMPLLVSIVVVLAGLGLGYAVYGRGYRAGQIDPLRKLLGPFWLVLHNKYFIDEIYQATIIPLSLLLSKVLYWLTMSGSSILSSTSSDGWAWRSVNSALHLITGWLTVRSAALQSWPIILAAHCGSRRMDVFRSICWCWRRPSQSG